MKKSNIKLINKVCLNRNKKLKYSNNQYKYNFLNVLSIPLILDAIFQFIEKDVQKCFSLCNKKLYKIYCNQFKKIKLKRNTNTLNISKFKLDKYENLIELNLEGCIYIKNISFLKKNINIKILNLARCNNIEDNSFIFISKLEKLEDLNLNYSNISDISVLIKNNNIKQLHLWGCENIKDFSFISKLEKLEKLNLSFTNISDISFLINNNNIKELNLMGCENIKDHSFISKLKKKMSVIY